MPEQITLIMSVKRFFCSCALFLQLLLNDFLEIYLKKQYSILKTSTPQKDKEDLMLRKRDTYNARQ